MNGWLRFYTSELKRSISYRVEFWVGLFGGLGSQFAVAYFVWQSIYARRGATTIEGFSFGSLMAYYLIAPWVERVVQGGEFGHISKEIYEGGLSKYLVYPVNFFGVKFMAHLAQSTFYFLQVLIVLVMLFGPTKLGLTFFHVESQIHLSHWFFALLLMVASIAVQFALTACLEQMAFWAENVWSLLVMLRMVIHLVGGSLVPLSFFPPAVSAGFRWLPFHCFIDLPTRLILGRATTTEAWQGLGIALVWAVLFGVMARFIWQKGLLRYSGAGM